MAEGAASGEKGTIDLDVPENEVLYAVSDRVATVTLNRPDRLNAITTTLPFSIAKAMRLAATDPGVRAIVITGAGRAFCAGADRTRLESGVSAQLHGTARETYAPDDPEFFAAVSSPVGPGFDDEFKDIRRFAYFMRIGKPIIAAVNGAAAGGGMIPALCADIRFASDKAFFTSAFAQRGVIAENAMAWLLPRLVGPSRALDMMLSARRVTAHEARESGLVNAVHPAETFMDEVMAYARTLANTVSPRAMAVIKAQVLHGTMQTYSEALALADREIEIASHTPDLVEGVAHFFEKRPANFPDLVP